jgi:transposase
MKTYMGVDYHKRFSYATLMDEQGQVLRQGRVANSAKALGAFLDGYDGADCAAVLEATRTWETMYDWLDERCGRVVLAHPLKVRAIAEASVKTDKIDAATLAQLLRADLIPPAHVGSPGARLLRRVLRHRLFLVRVRTMVKNRIHDLVDRHASELPKRPVAGLFCQAGLAWLRTIELDEPERAILESELDLLAHLGRQIASIEAQLEQIGRRDERLARLLTIPGVGRTVGLVLLAEVDQIERFATAAKLHAYAGLVPRVQASAGRVRHGPLVSACNKWLRWALIEAVWPAIRTDAGLRRYYQGVARRKGANTAKVATARRLLTIAYRVLKDGREYQ